MVSHANDINSSDMNAYNCMFINKNYASNFKEDQNISASDTVVSVCFAISSDRLNYVRY